MTFLRLKLISNDNSVKVFHFFIFKVIFEAMEGVIVFAISPKKFTYFIEKNFSRIT